jgi:hypothetical protein
MNTEEDLKKLRGLLKEFFQLLDSTEESDSGRIFKPIQITSCRALMIKPLNKLLNDLRKEAMREIEE